MHVQIRSCDDFEAENKNCRLEETKVRE